MFHEQKLWAAIRSLEVMVVCSHISKRSDTLYSKGFCLNISHRLQNRNVETNSRVIIYSDSLSYIRSLEAISYTQTQRYLLSLDRKNNIGISNNGTLSENLELFLMAST